MRVYNANRVSRDNDLVILDSSVFPSPADCPNFINYRDSLRKAIEKGNFCTEQHVRNEMQNLERKRSYTGFFEGLPFKTYNGDSLGSKFKDIRRRIENLESAESLIDEDKRWPYADTRLVSLAIYLSGENENTALITGDRKLASFALDFHRRNKKNFDLGRLGIYFRSHFNLKFLEVRRELVKGWKSQSTSARQSEQRS